ncbi:hypothetical protein OTH22_09625 [Bacteroides fragilis]|uniref:hypothetical protein n=1 Tax=Bacteroides hominis TaxID=2763023 RepID=UPI0029411468|nr:hypothetical protein [Bacteroides fragilis]
MMQYDTAATMGYVFGVKQPQVWTGRPMIQVSSKQYCHNPKKNNAHNINWIK